MPTPRRHGGAALQHIPMTLPAFRGLNTQAANSLLEPAWATQLLNSVLDENNRVAARRGWLKSSAARLPATTFIQVAEYFTHAGVSELVATSEDKKVFLSQDEGTTFSDITGANVVNDANVQMVNFDDDLVIAQAGGEMLNYDGTVLTTLTGSPQNSIALAAFGRVWAVASNGFEVNYCALLDQTDWVGGDTGVISVKNVWPESDPIVALAAFNGQLVIFGRNNIAVYDDSSGSPVGLDPTAAVVRDTIGGIGCIARDSVVNVKGDLWFLSRDGLQSLGRLIQEKSNPLINLSTNIQDALIQTINDPELDLANCRAVYSPEDKFYLLCLSRPRANTAGDISETGRVWAFDTRGRLEDGSARVVGLWTGLVPSALTKTRDNSLFISLLNYPGEIGKYSGYLDDGSSYQFIYESGWIDITGTQGYLIIPKRMDALVWIGQDVDVAFKWAFDFNNLFTIRTVSYVGVAAFSEYGEGEFGEAEWGGGGALKEAKVAASGTGEFVKLGVQAAIAGGPIAIQQLDLFAKIGRLK